MTTQTTWRIWRLGLSLSLLCVAACGNAPADRSTAQGAFAALAPCLESQEDACLLHLLDKQSRDDAWAAFAMLKEIRTLIEAHYPQETNGDASLPPTLQPLLHSPSGEAFFAAVCQRVRCGVPLREAFGAIETQTAQDEHIVELTTVRGGRFRMQNIDGEWGLAQMQSELKTERDRVYRVLSEVRRNAAAYDEQRRAMDAP
ncbi:MAG: hypothetical protein M0R76_12835 [Proteobacteria bacterium]|nr:hypothetical protein [Pseudomonadota bacterium]